MSAHEIHRGIRLAPGEAIVWRGGPPVGAGAPPQLPPPAAGGDIALLFALDAFQAWNKGLPLAKAVHDSVPLAAITVAALAILGALAALTARSTRYTVTDRRVVLNYGIAMPATLSLPYAQISSVAVAVRRDHGGDLALVLKGGNRMPYLKLWPLARPWHLSAPQPTLRLVPRAAVVGGLVVRALQAAEQARAAERREAVEASAPAEAALLSA